MTRTLHWNIIQGLIYPPGGPLRIPDVLAGNIHDVASVRGNVLAVQRPFLTDPRVSRIPAAGHRGHEDPVTAEGR
jgi:hypothetical protein